MTELDAEDNKLVVLARGALGRTGGTTGAAIRDTDGRTYAAGEVALQALRLTALQAAVAAAISSGAEGFEAAVVVGAKFSDAGVSAVREVSSAARIVFADRDGAVFDIIDDAEVHGG
ncbi:cytidine deaminase [Nocardia sp. NPDC050710]|uniref:cytidine deaminase n=1 Tax=Nocardia sp. NPDC050710 TaxID=3157220 RepID=UPI0033EAF45E